MSLSRWLPYRVPNAAASMRLFCFAHAGHGASLFRSWPEDLPASVEVCAVQLPGREGRVREPPIRRSDALLALLDHELERWRQDLPVALFGHSMGALLAFELARRWARRGQPPACLIVSGGCPPQSVDPDPPWYRLDDHALIEKLRLLEGTPEEVLADPELVGLYLPTLRADFELCETHRHEPGEPLPCGIAAYFGSRDAKAPCECADGWRVHARTLVKRVFAGGHHFIATDRAAVLRAVADDLTTLA